MLKDYESEKMINQQHASGNNTHTINKKVKLCQQMFSSNLSRNYKTSSAKLHEISTLPDTRPDLRTSKQNKPKITLLLDELVASLGVCVPNNLQNEQRKPRNFSVNYGVDKNRSMQYERTYNSKITAKKRCLDKDFDSQRNGIQDHLINTERHGERSDSENNNTKVLSKNKIGSVTQVTNEENSQNQFDSFKINGKRMECQYDGYIYNNLLHNENLEGDNSFCQRNSDISIEKNAQVKLKDCGSSFNSPIIRKNNNTELLQTVDFVYGDSKNPQHFIENSERTEKIVEDLKILSCMSDNLVLDEQNAQNIPCSNDTSCIGSNIKPSNNKSNIIDGMSRKVCNIEDKREKLEVRLSGAEGGIPPSFKTLNLEMDSLNSYIFTDSISRIEVFHDETANQGPADSLSDSEHQHLCESCCKLLSLHTFEERCKCVGKIEISRSSSNSVTTVGSSYTPKSNKSVRTPQKQKSHLETPRKNTSVSVDEPLSPESTTGIDLHSFAEHSRASITTPVNGSLTGSKQKAKKQAGKESKQKSADVSDNAEIDAAAASCRAKFNLDDISRVSPVPGPSGLNTQDYIHLLQGELLNKKIKSVFRSSELPSFAPLEETNKDLNKIQPTKCHKKSRATAQKEKKQRHKTSATWKIKLKETMTKSDPKTVSKQEECSSENVKNIKDKSNPDKSCEIKQFKTSKRKSTAVENVDKPISPSKSCGSNDSVFSEINNLSFQDKSPDQSDKQNKINLHQKENSNSHTSKVKSTRKNKSPSKKKPDLDKLLHEMILKEMTTRTGDNLDLSAEEEWKNKQIPSSTLNYESDTEAIFKEINCIDTTELEYHKTLSDNHIRSKKNKKHKLSKTDQSEASVASNESLGTKTHSKKVESQHSLSTYENSKMCSSKSKKRKRLSSTVDDFEFGKHSTEISEINDTSISKMEKSKKPLIKKEHSSSIIANEIEFASECKKSKKSKQNKQDLSSEGLLNLHIESCTVKSENNKTRTSGFRKSKSIDRNTRSPSCSESSFLEDDSEISPEIIKKLRSINIVIPWEIPPLHLGDDHIGTFPSKAVQTEKQALGIPIKKGLFTKAEDDRIKENFTMFCNLHDLPEDPKPFMNFKQPHGFIMVKDERVKFAQFISHGLSDRFLNTVYRRFCRIYWNKVASVGKFTSEEDAIILAYLETSNSNSPFLDLAKKFNRSGASVYYRYKVLTRDHQEKIKWTPVLMEQFLGKLLEVSKVQKISIFKKREITTEEFREISKSMKIPVFKLRQAWKTTIYPKIFGESIADSYSVVQVKLTLIDTLYESKADDWRQVDFSEIAKNYNGITGRVLYVFLKTMINQKVPQKYHNNLRRCIKYLEKHKEIIVNSRRKTIPVYKFENGRLIRR